MLSPSTAQAHDRRVQPPNAFRATEKAFKAYRDGRQVQPLPDILDFDAGGLATTPVVVSELAPPWLRDAQIFSIEGVEGVPVF